MYLFDILKQKIINGSGSQVDGSIDSSLLYEDKKGFVKYKLCRTSDLEKRVVSIDNKEIKKIEKEQWRRQVEQEDETDIKKQKIEKEEYELI